MYFIQKTASKLTLFLYAERQGFEPWDPFQGQHLSRMLFSAAQAPLLYDD